MARIARTLRVLVVTGIGLGAVVGGLGGRIAMLLLRVSSPDQVVGVVSDDGFVIGQVTMAGTYSLVATGAGLGLVGAAIYLLVRRWLIGPAWFRSFTCAAAAGAVVGSAIVHSDGVDFTLLKPTWLAISLFVLVPAAFGAAIGPAVRPYEKVDLRIGPGWHQWISPVIAIAMFPPSAFVVGVIAVVMVCWIPLGLVLSRVSTAPAYGVVVRGAWLAIATFGAYSLVGDVGQLT